MKKSIKKDMKFEKFEKNLGKYFGHDVIFKKGPYGYYLSHNNKNYSIQEENVEKMNLQLAQKYIREYIKNNKLLGNYQEKPIYLKNGKYGHYLHYNNNLY